MVGWNRDWLLHGTGSKDPWFPRTKIAKGRKTKDVFAWEVTNETTSLKMLFLKDELLQTKTTLSRGGAVGLGGSHIGNLVIKRTTQRRGKPLVCVPAPWMFLSYFLSAIATLSFSPYPKFCTHPNLMHQVSTLEIYLSYILSPSKCQLTTSW